MSEAVDDMLEGNTCDTCGEFHDKFLRTGRGYGYPKTCNGCLPDNPVERAIEDLKTNGAGEYMLKECSLFFILILSNIHSLCQRTKVGVCDIAFMTRCDWSQNFTSYQFLRNKK